MFLLNNLIVLYCINTIFIRVFVPKTIYFFKKLIFLRTIFKKHFLVINAFKHLANTEKNLIRF